MLSAMGAGNGAGAFDELRAPVLQSGCDPMPPVLQSGCLPVFALQSGCLPARRVSAHEGQHSLNT